MLSQTCTLRSSTSTVITDSLRSGEISQGKEFFTDDLKASLKNIIHVSMASSGKDKQISKSKALIMQQIKRSQTMNPNLRNAEIMHLGKAVNMKAVLGHSPERNSKKNNNLLPIIEEDQYTKIITVKPILRNGKNGYINNMNALTDNKKSNSLSPKHKAVKFIDRNETPLPLVKVYHVESYRDQFMNISEEKEVNMNNNILRKNSIKGDIDEKYKENKANCKCSCSLF
jgi:hypothetical protein